MVKDFDLDVTLSLFDGMSGGQEALKRAGITTRIYLSSEIERFPKCITRKNHPLTVQIGDVTKIVATDLPKVNLLLGGSPCQGFSFAGKQLNFEDPRSALFFEYVRLLKECKPDYFLLENVSMKQEYQDVISEHLGVEPIMINSSLVSAQNRKRLYWTNIPFETQIDDRGILLKDILDYSVTETLSDEAMAYMLRSESTTKHVPRLHARAKYEHEKSNTLTTSLGSVPHGVIGWVDREKSHCVDANYDKGGNPKSYFEKGRRQLVFDRPCELRDFNPDSMLHHAANATDIKGNESIKRVYADTGKGPTLTTMQGGHREPKVLIVPQQVRVRKHEVDIPNLQQLLKVYKNNSAKTNKQIAEECDVAMTKVEHWFRSDSSFAIPSDDVWHKLKEVIGIEITTFDESIMEFEIRDGKFEMADRVYNPEYKAPTVVASTVAKVLCGAIRGRYIEGNSGATEQRLEIRDDQKTNTLTTVAKDNVVVNQSERVGTIKNGGQGDRLYSIDGKGISLSANSGGTAGNGNMLIETNKPEPSYRKLTVKECSRLQTFHDSYLEDCYDDKGKPISDSQKYRALGNGWTVEVIAHILKGIKHEQ